MASGPGPVFMPIHSHRDLIVWQKGMDLSVDVYRLTKSFPPDELYSLVSQLRRSASSIPANIAEGRGRYSEKDFAHFVSVARGSVMEVDTFFVLLCASNICPTTRPSLSLHLSLNSQTCSRRCA